MVDPADLPQEYRDPQRAYSDLAQTLALYPGFAPRTDVYSMSAGSLGRKESLDRLLMDQLSV